MRLRSDGKWPIFIDAFPLLFTLDAFPRRKTVRDFTLKQRRSRARVSCVSLQKAPAALLVLAAFFLLGILLGRTLAVRCAETMGAELRRYLDGYMALHASGGISAAAAWKTALCFFRAPVLVFVLGFASLGVVLVPCVCAAQGFLFSFSLFCFAAGLGQEGFFLLLALFAVRLLIVLPCTLLLGSASWEASCSLAALSFGGGKRMKPAAYGSRCWMRFGVACVCLCSGTALELWLVPQVLARLLH